jgi:hypothetical protein
MLAEPDAIGICAANSDSAEGVRAFVGKRKPTFDKR